MATIKSSTETFKGVIKANNSKEITIDEKFDSVTKVTSLTNHVNDFLRPLTNVDVEVKITIEVKERRK